jgi:hypothetical protein
MSSTDDGNQPAVESASPGPPNDAIVSDSIVIEAQTFVDDIPKPSLDEHKGDVVQVVQDKKPSTEQQQVIPAPPNTPELKPLEPPSNLTDNIETAGVEDMACDFDDEQGENAIENITKTFGRFVMFGFAAPFIVATTIQGSNKLLCEVDTETKVEGLFSRLLCSFTELPNVFLASVLNFDIVGTIGYREAFGHKV